MNLRVLPPLDYDLDLKDFTINILRELQVGHGLGHFTNFQEDQGFID